MGHKGKYLTAPWGERAKIDCGITKLVELIWKLGIKTMFSCEDRDGLVDIAVPDSSQAVRYYACATCARYVEFPLSRSLSDLKQHLEILRRASTDLQATGYMLGVSHRKSELDLQCVYTHDLLFVPKGETTRGRGEFGTSASLG
jgi:hypothetical protein